MVRGFLILLCFIHVLSATELKDKAQSAFVDGDYNRALVLYDSLIISSEGVVADNARAMKAVIYEEYLGQLDSALSIYNSLLETSPDSRNVRRWQRRSHKIEKMLPEKEVYAAYRMTLMSRENAAQKAKKLQTLFDKYPTFSKREELGRLLITQHNNLRNFSKALTVMEELQKGGVSFKEELYRSARMYALRENFTRLAWVLITLLLVVSVYVLTKVDKQMVLRNFLKLLGGWLFIATLFSLAYYLYFTKDANNPFEWYAPLLLMGLMLIPLMWLSLSSTFFTSGKLFYPLGFIPSLLCIFLLYHSFLYYQKQPMVIMDTFDDRIAEFFGLKTEEVEDGEN